jgi:hypothetical protein
MGKFESAVTGIEAQVCSRCLELTTRVVALEHELYESQKREEKLRQALALVDGVEGDSSQ